MVEGRMKKFTGEISLTGQGFVKNPDQSVADLLKSKNADVVAFTRFKVGEGIEKQTVDFAEEGDIESISSIKLPRRPSSFTAEVIAATPVDD